MTSVFQANLNPVSSAVFSEKLRERLLRRPIESLAAICARAGIRCRVSGGPAVEVSFARGHGHGLTYDENCRRRYIIDRSTLPQRDPERAVRELEVLAYVLHDYAARETLAQQRIFVYPIQPEHGRAWLAEIGRKGGRKQSERKRRASRVNGLATRPVQTARS
jgi:hypothetical protein